jgi:hypothetical protein
LDNLLKFLNGQSNVAKLEVTILRDTLPNGLQYITIKHGDDELFSFWHNPGKTVKKDRPPPKHIGGKKPYIMLMVEEVEALRKQGVGNVAELIGYLVCLGRYIEWGTGRLIHKRSKKPLRYADLLKICGCSNHKLNRILAEMKEHDLLFGTQEGYFVSSRFIKKGKSKKREGNRNAY